MDFLINQMDFLIGICLYVVITLVHEGAHFSIARAFGIPVLSFRLGAGPAIYRRVFKLMEFQICRVPISGTILIPTMTVEELLQTPTYKQYWDERKDEIERQGLLEEETLRRYDEMYFARMMTVLAGPFTEFTLSIIGIAACIILAPENSDSILLNGLFIGFAIGTIDGLGQMLPLKNHPWKPLYSDGFHAVVFAVKLIGLSQKPIEELRAKLIFLSYISWVILPCVMVAWFYFFLK